MTQGISAAADGSVSEQEDDLLLISIDEQHAQRIRRIGRKLLRVSNCLITFGAVTEKQSDKERSMAAIEAQFSDSLPLSGAPEFVPDAKSHKSLSKHRLVVGAPYIRFYASHPIRNEVDEIVGNVRLIDYSPRVLGDEEKLLLSDLAVLVERELRFISMVATRQDLLKKNWSLRRDSMIDPLVGTWNRTAITRLLKQEIEQCKKDDKPLSLVMTDVDALKKLNTTYGRVQGDNLLIKVVSRLRSCIRPHDTLGRYDGGKFLILLPGASHDVAKLVAERLQNAVKSNSEKIGKVKVVVTVTSGTVSTDKFPITDSDELISIVSAALASAQKLGHNSIGQAVPNAIASSQKSKTSPQPFPTVIDI
jgi:diguanylate cyclase (GGDEF)-like protein